MKKQYDIYEGASFRYWIILYHDGIEVSKVKKWFGEELNTYIDEIGHEGYTRGYTKEDVEMARKKWEHIYENRIELNGWKEIK